MFTSQKECRTDAMFGKETDIGCLNKTALPCLMAKILEYWMKYAILS